MSSQGNAETTAVHISDEELFRDAGRLKDKVVVITGAANGIGKEVSIKMASYGAKIVIGDLDVPGAEKVVEEIRNTGGKAVSLKVDVTVFDDITALYELADNTYGSVDVVIPNAGVTELDRLGDIRYDSNGKPKAPQWKTIQINLIGVLNTLHLAQYYLLKKSGDLKSVVLLGSIASWLTIPPAPQYTASKHGVLGIMRSLHPIYKEFGIQTACIHPFFADTNIIGIPEKIFLSGIPLVPVPRISGAIIYAATSTNPATNGSALLLPDNGPVFRVPKEEFKLGVYAMIDSRSNALFKYVLVCDIVILDPQHCLFLIIKGCRWDCETVETRHVNAGSRYAFCDCLLVALRSIWESGGHWAKSIRGSGHLVRENTTLSIFERSVGWRPIDLTGPHAGSMYALEVQRLPRLNLVPFITVHQ
ncbi:hypothetical protein V5O48_006288 [Marasmius crinis-equi]|uniref:NAD(P)-binding protein n=1 Tax=Marasmius crinis-equi TaxID=585013 RepID=A0ABR3FKH8_9AGAR